MATEGPSEGKAAKVDVGTEVEPIYVTVDRIDPVEDTVAQVEKPIEEP